MTKSKKRKIYFGLFWFFLAFSFICFALFLIFTAHGYHLNTTTLKIEKTGMIVLNGKISQVKVILNGKEKATNIPDRFTLLFPGPYNLTVQKEGYSSYQKTFKLAGGQAVVINNLLLFSKTPKITILNNEAKTIAQIKKTNLSQTNQIEINGTEIRKNGILATRFSQTVIAAIYESSTDHYYIQLPDGIHTILGDGSNDVLLIPLDKNTPALMAVNNNLLSYIIDDKIFQAGLWQL